MKWLYKDLHEAGLHELMSYADFIENEGIKHVPQRMREVIQELRKNYERGTNAKFD